MAPDTVLAAGHRRYWWVSQGYNHDTAIEQGTLWTTPSSKRRLPDRELVRDMQPGDIVLHYAKRYLRAVSVVEHPWQPGTRPPGYNTRPGDGDEGWLVPVQPLRTGLRLHFSAIGELVPHGPPGPLDRNGVPQQIYVAELQESWAYALLAALDVDLREFEDGSVLGRPATAWEEVDTDREAWAALRTEQAHLRAHLLAGRSEATCSLCHRTLPSRMLVAAHITPRRLLTHDERLDFERAAKLLCVLGCDALFEWGYVVVAENGQITTGRHAQSADLAAAVGTLTGRRCLAHGSRTAAAFRRHRAARCSM